MARKAKSRPVAAAPPPEFKVNPFADLRVPAEPAAAPPPPPAPPRPPPAAPAPTLDPEDLALLEAFKDAGSIEFGVREEGLHLALCQRRGGRWVTQVRGLPELSLLEQMRLTGDIRVRFGLAAHFRERLLEVEGDQRERLLPWLRSQGYKIAGQA
jgi:translation initiation factor 1 (eIF-1/SUI1)